MTRTKITRVAHNYVVLEATDPFTDEAIRREFMCPSVREPRTVAYVREQGRQVCSGLSSMGPTLVATPDTLADVIRKEWRAYRASAKRQGF